MIPNFVFTLVTAIATDPTWQFDVAVLNRRVRRCDYQMVDTHGGDSRKNGDLPAHAQASTNSSQSIESAPTDLISHRSDHLEGKKEDGSHGRCTSSTEATSQRVSTELDSSKDLCTHSCKA